MPAAPSTSFSRKPRPPWIGHVAAGPWPSSAGRRVNAFLGWFILAGWKKSAAGSGGVGAPPHFPLDGLAPAYRATVTPRSASSRCTCLTHESSTGAGRLSQVACFHVSSVLLGSCRRRRRPSAKDCIEYCSNET